MPLTKKRSVLAIEAEGTPGTVETLVAGDAAFNAYNVSITPNVDLIERDGQEALSKLVAINGGYAGSASFELDLYTNAAWAGDLLPACGFAGASGGVYAPSSTSSNWGTVTIGHYIDGKLFRLAGAMGSFTMRFRAGQVTRVAFDMTGVWQAPTDATILSPTFPTATSAAPRWAGASALTLGSQTLLVSQMDIAVTNEVSLLEDPTDTSGFLRAWIGSRSVGGMMDPQEELVASWDAHGKGLASTQEALTNTYGSMSISLPKVQMSVPGPGERSGVSALQVEFMAARSAAAGDDEISIDLAA